MSLPRPSHLLQSIDAAKLPAALAALLVLGAILQAVLPVTPRVPPVALAPFRPGANDAVLAGPATIPPYPSILATPIFAPRGGKAVSGESATGFVLAGTALSRSAALAIVRSADGVEIVHPGQSVAGLRLVTVARDGALFVDKDGRRVLRIGAAIGAAPQQPAAAGEEDR